MHPTPGNAHAENRKGHPYLRFLAMLITATAVMYGLTYVNTYQSDHIRWSEQRGLMSLIMGAVMAIVMLSFMWGMHKNTTINVGIIAASLLLLTLGVVLVRTQTTIQDRSYMSAMIPHHSIAILTSERSEITDVRVCRLAVEIIEAQRREIELMKWLIADIGANGFAETVAAAEARPAPSFAGTSLRSCG